jgi:hypothetical protein
MDIRTGKTYRTREEALEAGVPESDLALIERGPDGEPRPSFANPPKLRFSKGSFKQAEEQTAKINKPRDRQPAKCRQSPSI